MLIAVVVVSWGFNVPVMKYGVEMVPPLSLTVSRFVLTALLFLPFAGKISLADLRKLVPVSLFFISGNLLLGFFALSLITGNSFVVLTQIAQPVTMILAWIFFKEKFGLKTTLGILVAFSGLVIVFGAPDIREAPMGALLTICSALSWACGSLSMKRTAHIKPAALLAYSYLMGAPVAIIATYMLERDQIESFLAAPPLALGFVIFYQVVMMGLMIVIWGRLMARNQAQYVTPFLMLQPIISVIGGYYLNGEKLEWSVFAGGLVVLLGIGIIHWRNIVKRRVPKALKAPPDPL